MGVGSRLEIGGSKLADEQVAHHLSGSDPYGDTESRKIQCGAKHVCETKWQHRWDPTLGQLQRPASILWHHILLDRAAPQMVDTSRRIMFCLERTCRERILATRQDVEVVVCGVSSSVTLGSNGSSEEDQVLGDGSMNDVHASHSTTGIVKHPFGFGTEMILVEIGGCFGVSTELEKNVVKDGAGIAWVLGNSGGGDLVDLLAVEDVEARANGVESSNQSTEADKDG